MRRAAARPEIALLSRLFCVRWLTIRPSNFRWYGG